MLNVKEKDGQLIIKLLNVKDFKAEVSADDFKDIDQMHFYWWSLVHRVNGYFGKHIVEIPNIKQSVPNLTYLLNYDYKKIEYKVNRVSSKIMPKINKILEEANIKFVFLKGAITANQVFDCAGERDYNDIDILIAKRDLKKVKNILKNNNYSQGYGDENDNVKCAYFEMTTHQTLPFSLKNEMPFLPYFSLDINFAFGPEEKLKNKSMIDEVLDAREFITYNENTFPTLSCNHLFIYLCIHIWRDAVYVHSIRSNKDIKLYQYLELNKLIIKNKLDWEYIYEFIVKYNLEQMIYYVLHYIMIIYPSLINELLYLKEKIKFKDLSFLDKFGIENGSEKIWPIPFEERIFNNKKFETIIDRYSLDEFKDFIRRQTIIED